MLNMLAEHTCGAYPRMMAGEPEVEARCHGWAENNGIGTAIREIRRDAAKFGIGIGIPYIADDCLPGEIPLRIRTVPRDQLADPLVKTDQQKIYDGIEYDENWDVVAIYVDDYPEPKRYEAKEIFLYYKKKSRGIVNGPECGPAFCLYPSVRRFMEAIVKGEEFISAIPMVCELDPLVWGKDDVDAAPRSTFTYKPGQIPTLPPGVKLSGINVGIRGSERNEHIKLVMGAAGRTISMPQSLVLGDSSGSNMSVASYDVQPWENKVRIDRSDLTPLVRKIYGLWMSFASKRMGYLPTRLRNKLGWEFPYEVKYDYVFKHPDPNKNAAARAADIISGSTTLHSIYTEQCKNPEQEIQRECKLFGITPAQWFQIRLTAYSQQALAVLGLVNENSQRESDSNRQEDSED